MRKKIFDETTIKFILVGGINTMVGMSTMYIAYNVFGCSYWVSSALNYIVGSIVSFFLNKKFTFRSKSSAGPEVLRFVANIAICYLIGYGIAKPLMKAVLSGYSVKVQENVAMFVGGLFFTGLNYLGQKFFVFKGKD